MSLRQRLTAKLLPERTVTLPPLEEGGAPDVVTVRALAAPEWDALLQLHEPTDEQAKAGWAWDLATFRPALLAACVVSPADEGEPLDADDWAQLLATMPFGDRELLWGAALDANENRWPDADQGKGSTGTPSTPPSGTT